MTNRRRFLSTSALVMGGGALSAQGASPKKKTELPAYGNVFDHFENFFPVPPSTPRNASSTGMFGKNVLTPYKSFVERVASTDPVDAVVGISEVAINKFILAHFNDNPGMYDRSRESKVSPIYEQTFNDHNKVRVFKFFGAVRPQKNKPPLYLNLSPDAAQAEDLKRYWRLREKAAGTRSDLQSFPPNVQLIAPRVVVQIDFPKLGTLHPGEDTNHHIDLEYGVDIRAYITLTSDHDASAAIKMTDFDIKVTPLNDPLDPPAVNFWGAVQGQELVEARLALRDLITIGANIALTELCKTFTRAIPFPPIDVIKGAVFVPRELFIHDKHIGVTAVMQPSRDLANEAMQDYATTIKAVERDLRKLKFEKFRLKDGGFDVKRFHQIALQECPSYKRVFDKHDELTKISGGGRVAAAPPIPKNDLFVMISSKFFDRLAKSFLTVSHSHCTDWAEVSLLIASLRGRACYWFQLSEAHGGVSGTNISMGCNVKAGGNLDLEACLHALCAPDICATYSPGIGLKGPLGVSARLINLSWSENSALMIHPSVDSFPGLQLYGFFDPILGELTNVLLGKISGVFFQAFFNSIVSALNFMIIQFGTTVPKTNVRMDLHDFGAENVDDMLVVTGTTDFS